MQAMMLHFTIAQQFHNLQFVLAVIIEECDVHRRTLCVVVSDHVSLTFQMLQMD